MFVYPQILYFCLHFRKVSFWTLVILSSLYLMVEFLCIHIIMIVNVSMDPQSSSMDPSKWFHGYNGSSMDTLVIPWIHSVFYACIQLSCSCIHGSIFLSSFQKAFIMELASGIHGSMSKYPWNLDMMKETFTHVQDGFPWKQDGSMETS